MDLAKEIAKLAFLKRLRGHYSINTKEIEAEIMALVEMAVKEERKRCAEVAWKMQQERFGGGTAIGNTIQEG